MTLKNFYDSVKIILDVYWLIENDITAEEYLFVYLIHIGEKYDLSEYQEDVHTLSNKKVKKLIKKDVIEKIDDEIDSIKIDNLRTTKKFKDLLDGDEENDVNIWISEWYNLWPKGIKTGGYYLRTDKAGSLRKMKTFLAENPLCDRNLIFQATKNYLDEQSLEGYKFTKLAPYFIRKGELSVLAGECEALLDNPTKETAPIGFGQDEL